MGFICHMSDEIISSESEATVNNQNPSTPRPLPPLVTPVKGTTHIDYTTATNNAKRVEVGSQRRESEPEGDANIKLNLCCLYFEIFDGQ